MNAANTVWLMWEAFERDELGASIEYARPRNGYADRAAAATGILEEQNVLQDPRNPAHFFVPSEEHGMLRVYDVHLGEPPACTCEDHVEKRHVFCKHVLAARRVYYLQRAFEMEQTHVTAPTRRARREWERQKERIASAESEADLALLFGGDAA